VRVRPKLRSSFTYLHDLGPRVQERARVAHIGDQQLPSDLHLGRQLRARSCPCRNWCAPRPATPSEATHAILSCGYYSASSCTSPRATLCCNLSGQGVGSHEAIWQQQEVGGVPHLDGQGGGRAPSLGPVLSHRLIHLHERGMERLLAKTTIPLDSSALSHAISRKVVAALHACPIWARKWCTSSAAVWRATC
jgi:hypothetical protein